MYNKFNSKNVWMSVLLRKTTITFAPVSVNGGRFGFHEHSRTPNVKISALSK